jgi:hypothetical protein
MDELPAGERSRNAAFGLSSVPLRNVLPWKPALSNVRRLPISLNMRVNANSGPQDVSCPRRKPAVTKPTKVEDQADLKGVQALDRALAQTPASRSGEVARAKALLSDPAYPAPKVLRSVAARLSRELKRGEP